MTGTDSSRVWTLTDGHAGNVRQAEALARALHPDTLQTCVLRSNALARALAPRRFPFAASSLGNGLAAALRERPQLAIGCGRQAALATRLLRAHGSRVVQILDPRIDPRHWDLVIAPEHDGLSGANVITLLGSLNPVDDAWLADARAQFAAFADFPAPRTVLLLGGPGRHADCDQDTIESAVRMLRERAAQSGGSVLATASRRTPPALVVCMRELLSATPGFVWADERDGANPYPGMLAWADRIVCSADSVNMLSEAAATAAPMHIIGDALVHGRPRRFVDALIASGRARANLDEAAAAAIVPLRETARVAMEVRRRLQGD